MTVADMILLFPDSSDVQFNILTPEGRLVYIPDSAFYRHTLGRICSIDYLPVHSVDVEVEEVDGKPIKLLIIDTREESEQ